MLPLETAMFALAKITNMSRVRAALLHWAANVTGHYMAEGKRVLITSRSSAALEVIREKITGTSSMEGVFEEGDALQELIFSWGDKKEALKRFSAANKILHDLKATDAGEDQHTAEVENSRDDARRLSGKINEIEQSFSVRSQIACMRLRDIAKPASGGGQEIRLAVIAKVFIDQLCSVHALRLNEITEVKERKPKEIAVRIREEIEKPGGAFQSFEMLVEADLQQVLEDEGKSDQLSAWFKNAIELREHLEKSLKTRPSASSAMQEDDKREAAKEGRRWSMQPFQMVANAATNAAKLLAGWGSTSTTGDEISSQEVLVVEKPKIVSPPGLVTWEKRIAQAERGEDDIDAVVPKNWQTYFILLSCKHFLAKLFDNAPQLNMDDKCIESREVFETDRRKAFRKMVGRETRRHALERFSSHNFASKLAYFVQKYEEFSKMAGKSARDKSKYFAIQHELFRLFDDSSPDGRPAQLLDALPIWIMPTELVSQMLPSKLGLFDVVILEEASQSDCQVIPVLLRGKKVIIIGDNDQVNPEKKAPGFQEMVSERLKRSGSLPAATIDNLLPGKSIFDLFEKRFAERMTTLREHFRSVHALTHQRLKFS